MGLDNRASAGEPDQFRQLRRPAGLKGNGSHIEGEAAYAEALRSWEEIFGQLSGQHVPGRGERPPAGRDRSRGGEVAYWIFRHVHDRFSSDEQSDHTHFARSINQETDTQE